MIKCDLNKSTAYNKEWCPKAFRARCFLVAHGRSVYNLIERALRVAEGTGVTPFSAVRSMCPGCTVVGIEYAQVMYKVAYLLIEQDRKGRGIRWPRSVDLPL